MLSGIWYQFSTQSSLLSRLGHATSKKCAVVLSIAVRVVVCIVVVIVIVVVVVIVFSINIIDVNYGAFSAQILYTYDLKCLIFSYPTELSKFLLALGPSISCLTIICHGSLRSVFCLS